MIVTKIPAEIDAWTYVPRQPLDYFPVEMECGGNVKVAPVVALSPTEIGFESVVPESLVPREGDFAGAIRAGSETESEAVVSLMVFAGRRQAVEARLSGGVGDLCCRKRCRQEQNNI